MRCFMTLLILLVLALGFVSCSKDETEFPPQAEQPDISELPDEPVNNRLKVIIGDASFSVALEDNVTVKNFIAQLPLTVVMSELNGNEKYFDLPVGLSTAPADPGTINTGDLMLYGSATVVLFYKTFSTPYSYTRLGRIENTLELANVLGSGSVQVKFELQ